MSIPVIQPTEPIIPIIPDYDDDWEEEDDE